MSDDSSLQHSHDGPSDAATWRGTLIMATVIQATIVAILFVAGQRTRDALFASLLFLMFDSRAGVRLTAPALPYVIAGVIVTFLLVLSRPSVSGANVFVVAFVRTVLIITGEWVLTWLAFVILVVVSIATGHFSMTM